MGTLIDDKYWESDDFINDVHKIQDMTDEEFEKYLKEAKKKSEK